MLPPTSKWPVLPRDLPEFIAVDLSKMETGTTLHANDLVVPEGVKMVTDSVIASVIQPVEEEIIAPAAAEGDAAAAAPADGAAAPAAPRPSNPSGYFRPLLELSGLQQTTAQAREASNPSRCGLFAYLQKTFDFQSLHRGIFLRMPDLVWSLPPLAERMHSAACLISIAGFTQHLLNASSAFVSEF